METKSIMIVGVGGQGSLLASRILGNVLLQQGFAVKVSEVHGMSQRGGSVVTYVRYSEDKVASPVICRGEADYLLCFEQLEAARWIEYLKPDGVLVANTQKMLPMPVITGAAEYPQGIIEDIKSKGVKVIDLDALSLAAEAGSEKAVNIVLIGAFARFCEFSREEVEACIKSCVPPKFLEINLKAFELGYNSAK